MSDETTTTTTTTTMMSEAFTHLAPGEMIPVPDDVPLPSLSAPVASFEKTQDREVQAEMIHLASRVPDARGLEEIKDPFLKAKVADALDVGRDPETMRHLGRVLAVRYPQASARVLKQADYLARMAAR